MTEHSTACFKMDVFDNEWRPLIKLFNRAMTEDDHPSFQR